MHKKLGDKGSAGARFICALVFLQLLLAQLGSAQTQTRCDSVADREERDSLTVENLDYYKQQLVKAREQWMLDSMRRVALERELQTLKQSDRSRRTKLSREIGELQASELARREDVQRQRARIDTLRKRRSGSPVLGPLNDTLFLLYGSLGAYDWKQRAELVTARLREAYRSDLISEDSVSIELFDAYWNIRLDPVVLHTVTENDALWANVSSVELTKQHAERIDSSLRAAREESSIARVLLRGVKVVGVLVITLLVIFLIVRLSRRIEMAVARNRKSKLRPIVYRSYTVLTEHQIKQAIRSVVRLLRWMIFLVSLYLLIPVILGIFPEARGWSDSLFGLIVNPFRRLGLAMWHYLPKVFAIFAILVVVHDVLRLIRYFFREISVGHLKVQGFHQDWGKPTFSIVKVLVYAFTLVLVFPYLPGSNSPIFQGVSVFLGLLVSLGSSSAIANIVAGIVITYMRPFKIGDRIRIGDTVGDVVEKGLLVTRIRSITNEAVTIPNSTLLATKTINYETYSQEEGGGAMVYVPVSFGFEVPWQDVREILLEAVRRTEGIEQMPAPFVLQMGLSHNGVEYQVGGYTRRSKEMLVLRSTLYANIIDVSTERGVELLSPTYYAQRDGNKSTVPPYPPLDASYVPPS